jgi:hypothetical protein
MIVFKFMANIAIWITIASVFATVGQQEKLVSLQIKDSRNTPVSFPAFVLLMFSENTSVKRINCSYYPEFLHYGFLAEVYNPTPGSRLAGLVNTTFSLTVTDIFHTGTFTGVIMVN